MDKFQQKCIETIERNATALEAIASAITAHTAMLKEQSDRAQKTLDRQMAIAERLAVPLDTDC